MKLKLVILLFFFATQTVSLQAQVLTASVSKTYMGVIKHKELVFPSYNAKGCANADAVAIVIDEAITSGAPTYNGGNHVGCFRIYEGASYKILYKYGAKCKEVKGVLEAALEKAYGDYSATEKAWIMRQAFDFILDVPTQTQAK